MFSLVVCSVLVSSVFGGPILGGPYFYGASYPTHLPVGVVHTAPAAVVPVPLLHSLRSQFHSQDELGQYSYGYSNEHSSKVETKDFTGLTSGGYSYIDANGLVQNINYIADDVNGFRVAASNLPVAPVAPVAPVPVAPAVPAVPLPEPVSDTPEVQKAKEEHEKAKAEAEKALAAAAAASSSSSEESKEEGQSTETAESTENSAESTEVGKDGSSEEDSSPATSPATPAASPEAAQDSSSSSAQSDAGSQPAAPQPELAAQNPEAPVVLPQIAIDGAQIHSYVGNPIFRAGPPYLTYSYLPGAYVALNKREAPAVMPAPEGKFFSIAGPLNKRHASPAKFPTVVNQDNVNTNAVNKRR